MANPKFGWLHSLRTCCLSGRADIEISHLHEKSFTSSNQKVSDVLVLPMSKLLHLAQHKHPREFWPGVFPGSKLPYTESRVWAERLHDIWEKRDLEGAADLLADMQARADRRYLRQFLL